MDANFEKFENEKNERFNAVLHKYSIKSTETSLKRHIIYFPGDIQNYETIMKNDEIDDSDTAAVVFHITEINYDTVPKTRLLIY